MKKYRSDCVKKDPEYISFKATKQKPAGLLRTPVYSEGFKILTTNLFAPLSETKKKVSNGYSLLKIVQQNGQNYFLFLNLLLVIVLQLT